MHRHDAPLAKLDAATIVAASRGVEILIRPTVQALQAADVREQAEGRPATDRPSKPRRSGPRPLSRRARLRSDGVRTRQMPRTRSSRPYLLGDPGSRHVRNRAPGLRDRSDDRGEGETDQGVCGEASVSHDDHATDAGAVRHRPKG
jgi:hypothetical protein